MSRYLGYCQVRIRFYAEGTPGRGGKNLTNGHLGHGQRTIPLSRVQARSWFAKETRTTPPPYPKSFTMSGFVLGGEKTSFKQTGRRVTFPQNDVNRLSYYLYCVTVSLGMDIIKDDLVDFRQAHRLPRSRQDAVFELAVGDFRPEHFIDKLIFHDEKGELCGTSNNEFYEVTKVQSMLAIQSSVLIGGERRQVTKIMVFKRSWIEQHYVNPIQRNKERIQRITKASSQGGDAGELLAGLLLGLLVDAVKSEDTSSDNQHRHCSHCRGLEGKCACEHGCPLGMNSKCYAVHESVTCDGCHTAGIRGERFQCTVCFDYDLCEKCYNEGGKRHDLSHAFRRIDRVGCEPVELAPRRCEVPKQQQPPRKNFTQPSSSFTQEVPVVRATPVVDASSSGASGGTGFSVGDKVELVGLQTASMNGAIAVVEQDAIMGGRLQVRLQTKLPGRLSSIKPENLKLVIDFKPGQVVVLVGLKSSDMNGCQAIIDSYTPGERVLVRLYGDRVVSVKPENIEVLADILD